MPSTIPIVAKIIPIINAVVETTFSAFVNKIAPIIKKIIELISEDCVE